VLGVEQRLADTGLAWATLSAIMAMFSSRPMPSATSTWKSQVLPTMHTASAALVSSALRPGSLAALWPGRRVMPKAVKVAWLRWGEVAKKSSSTGLAPGQPPST
jgi:hypothetical protein